MKRTFALLILLSAVFANAQWTNNTNLNTPVTTAVNDQFHTKSVSDGAGGVIVAWQDSRTNSYDIYVQKMNANGVKQWTTNGLAVCTATFDQTDPILFSDGAGGAYIVWTDYRIDTFVMIYAQHIDALGNISWAVNGKKTCSQFTCFNLDAIADGSGGFYIAYRNYAAAGDRIYAQHFDSQANPLWGAEDVDISGDAIASSNAKMALDGSGGVIITYRKDGDIYAQRMSASGTALWATGGNVIKSSPLYEYETDIIADGAGGAYITWNISTAGHLGYFVQNVNGAGTLQWPSEKTIINTSAYALKLLEDGQGGFIAAWTDYRVDANNARAYTQRFDNQGIAQWAENGVSLKAGTAANPQSVPTIYRNGDGNIYYTFQDGYTNGNTWFARLFAQKFTMGGVAQWNPNGVAICTYAYTYLRDVSIVPNGSGGMIVTFANDRVNADYDIFVQTLYPNGLLAAETFKTAMDFSIYPNPTQSEFNVKSTVEIDKIIVSDVLGKEILRVAPNALNTTIQLNKHAKGVYLIKLISGENETVKKLILN